MNLKSNNNSKRTKSSRSRSTKNKTVAASSKSKAVHKEHPINKISTEVASSNTAKTSSIECRTSKPSDVVPSQQDVTVIASSSGLNKLVSSAINDYRPIPPNTASGGLAIPPVNAESDTNDIQFDAEYGPLHDNVFKTSVIHGRKHLQRHTSFKNIELKTYANKSLKCDTPAKKTRRSSLQRMKQSYEANKRLESENMTNSQNENRKRNARSCIVDSYDFKRFKPNEDWSSSQLQCMEKMQSHFLALDATTDLHMALTQQKLIISGIFEYDYMCKRAPNDRM